jgi:hypothetical protein
MGMKQFAFMVMPFHDEVAVEAYEHCIRGVCESRGLTVRRADEVFTVNPIWDDIFNEIHRARVIIADISGRNPNVFYELGMAHVLKQQQTVIITRDDHADVPFDVSHLRIIRYENSIQGSKRFEIELGKTLDLILQDLKALHRDEFTLIANALDAVGETAVLGGLVGMRQSPAPVKRADNFVIEFSASPDGNCQGAFAGPAEEYLRMLDVLGYTECTGDYVVLSPKGDAFASFLEDRGWVCHYMNGVRLTPGYLCLVLGERPDGPWPPR